VRFRLRRLGPIAQKYSSADYADFTDSMRWDLADRPAADEGRALTTIGEAAFAHPG
jgi:hypothetical protein